MNITTELLPLSFIFFLNFSTDSGKPRVLMINSPILFSRTYLRTFFKSNFIISSTSNTFPKSLCKICEPVSSASLESISLYPILLPISCTNPALIIAESGSKRYCCISVIFVFALEFCKVRLVGNSTAFLSQFLVARSPIQSSISFKAPFSETNSSVESIGKFNLL